MVDKTLVSHALGHAVADAAYRIAQTQTAYADQPAEEQFKVVVDEVRACLRGRPAPERAELLDSLEAAFPLPQDQAKGERPAPTSVRAPSDWKDALAQLKQRADSLSPTERDTMRTQVRQSLGLDAQPPTVPPEVLRNVKSARDMLVKCRKPFLNVNVPAKPQQGASTDTFAQLAELAGDVIREVSALDAAVKKVCEMSEDDFKKLDQWFNPETIRANNEEAGSRQLWEAFEEGAKTGGPRDRIRTVIKEVMEREIKNELRKLTPNS